MKPSRGKQIPSPPRRLCHKRGLCAGLFQQNPTKPGSIPPPKPHPPCAAKVTGRSLLSMLSTPGHSKALSSGGPLVQPSPRVPPSPAPRTASLPWALTW